MTDFYLGTMGYGYTQWQDGVFYPQGMPARRFLNHYSQIFNAVEMDTTFYGTPKPDRIQGWVAQVPANFIFCPKVPQQITHEQRLSGDAHDQMQTFLEVMRLFGKMLGAILIQLPPDMTTDEISAVEKFVAQLPADLRFTLEFRHRSWYKRTTSEWLQAHHIAWTSTEYIHLPKQVHVTTNFVYLRLLGKHGNFTRKDHEQVDSTPRLQWWWEHLKPHLDHLKTVYIFANNDYTGHSPTTINKFKTLLGLPTVPTRPPQQPRLLI